MRFFVAAKAVIQNAKGQVLLVREGEVYEEGTNAGTYDVPGGRIEPGELLLDALHREVAEEAEILVAVGRILHVADTFNVIQGETVHIIRHYFHCTTKETTVVLSTDHDQYAWVDPSKIDSYAVLTDVATAIQAIYEKTAGILHPRCKCVF